MTWWGKCMPAAGECSSRHQPSLARGRGRRRAGSTPGPRPLVLGKADRPVDCGRTRSLTDSYCGDNGLIDPRSTVCSRRPLRGNPLFGAAYQRSCQIKNRATPMLPSIQTRPEEIQDAEWGQENRDGCRGQFPQSFERKGALTPDKETVGCRDP